MPQTSAPSLCGAWRTPRWPGGGGKCAVEHESVVRKVPSGWSPHVVTVSKLQQIGIKGSYCVDWKLFHFDMQIEKKSIDT